MAEDKYIVRLEDYVDSWILWSGDEPKLYMDAIVIDVGIDMYLTPSSVIEIKKINLQEALDICVTYWVAFQHKAKI